MATYTPSGSLNHNLIQLSYIAYWHRLLHNLNLPTQPRKETPRKKIRLTIDRIDSSFSLALEDLKAPIMQTGVDSPHRASKLEPVSGGICFSSVLVFAFLVLSFLFFFSKPSSNILRSLIADLMSFTEIPVFRTCFSPFDSQPTMAGSASTPNLIYLKYANNLGVRQCNPLPKKYVVGLSLEMRKFSTKLVWRNLIQSIMWLLINHMHVLFKKNCMTHYIDHVTKSMQG